MCHGTALSATGAGSAGVSSGGSRSDNRTNGLALAGPDAGGAETTDTITGAEAGAGTAEAEAVACSCRRRRSAARNASSARWSSSSCESSPTPSQLSSVQYRGYTRHECASGRGEEGDTPSRARRQWSPRRLAGSRSRCEPPWASRRRSRRAQRGFGWGSGEASPTARPPRLANTQRQPLCHSGTQVRSGAFCAASWRRRAYVAHRAGVPWSPSTRRG